MAINNINQINFFNTDATNNDQPVQGDLQAALKVLEMVEKAKATIIEAAAKADAHKLAVKKVTVSSKATDDAYTKILAYLRAIAASDPNAMQGLLDYLSKLSPDVMNDPKITALLEQYKDTLGKAMQVLFMFELMGNKDNAQVWAWLQTHADLYKNIPGVAAMAQYLENNFGKLVNEVTDSRGNRVWHPAGSDNRAEPYSWDKYKDLIKILMANGQMPGAPDSPAVPNPFVDITKDIAAKIKADNMAKINAATNVGQAFMILMATYDSGYSSEENSLGYSTDMLSHLTNDIAAPLLAFIQNNPTGKFPEDLSGLIDFARMLSLVKEVVNSSPQLQSIAQNLMTALDSIRSQTGTVDGKPMTLGEALDIFMKDPASQQGIGPLILVWKTIASSQGMINNLQQIGALFTGMSKQVSTNLSIVANKDNEVIKLGNAAASSKEAYQQMISSIIHGQRTN